MRTAVLVTTIIVLLDVSNGATVREALKLLPKEDQASLARIEAFDGTPVPERWHILVYEPESERGVKEYVVANGELIISREISQFADKLSPNDVIGDTPVKVDSDKLADLAEAYAEANDIEVAKMSYHIARQMAGAPPTWRVQCMDNENKVLGALSVNAETGDIVSHEGFAIAPAVKKDSDAPRTAKSKKENRPQARSRSRSSQQEPEPIASRERSRGRGSQRERAMGRPIIRQAKPVANGGVGGFMRRLFRARN